MREKRVSVRILIIEFYYGYEECDDYRGQLGGTVRDRCQTTVLFCGLCLEEAIVISFTSRKQTTGQTTIPTPDEAA